jgi:hypothetical protein
MPAVVPILVGGAVATGAAATIGTAIAGAAIGTAVATGIGAAVVGTGAALATGQKPSDALKTGVVSGLTAGVGSSIGSAVAGAGTLSDAAFVAADAAQLAGQGLSEAAIAQNIVATGVSSTTAATAASLAASGATESAIASSLGPGTLFTETPAPTPSSVGGTPGVSQVYQVAPPGGTSAPLPPQAAGSSLAAGAPIVNATPVPAGELAFPAREVGVLPPPNATPVPGSFQAALPGLGVETAASAAPFTAAAGSFQAALPSLLTPAAAAAGAAGLGISAGDALLGAALLGGGQQQTATGFPQQQAPFQPAGVDYSGIYGLLGQRASVPGIQGLLGPAQLRYPSLLR